MQQHIGKNIRLFRIKYDISMDEVVAATGLTRDTLYKVERGVLFGIIYKILQDWDSFKALLLGIPN